MLIIRSADSSISLVQCIYDAAANTLVVRHSGLRLSENEPGSGGYIVHWESLDLAGLLDLAGSPSSISRLSDGENIPHCDSGHEEIEVMIETLIKNLIPEEVEVKKHGEIEIPVLLELTHGHPTKPLLPFLATQKFILSHLEYDIDMEIDGSLTDAFEFRMTSSGYVLLLTLDEYLVIVDSS